MPPTRRKCLHSLGVGFSVALSGCLYGPLFDSDAPFDPEEHLDDWHPEPVLAQGDPIEVDRCGSGAVDDLESEVKYRADASSIWAGHQTSSEIPEPYLYVNRVIFIGSDQEVQEMPEVSFETIQNVAPASAELRDDDRDYTCPADIYVYDIVYQTAP